MSPLPSIPEVAPIPEPPEFIPKPTMPENPPYPEIPPDKDPAIPVFPKETPPGKYGSTAQPS